MVKIILLVDNYGYSLRLVDNWGYCYTACWQLMI